MANETMNPYTDKKVFADYHWDRVQRLQKIQSLWRELEQNHDLTNPSS